MRQTDTTQQGEDVIIGTKRGEWMRRRVNHVENECKRAAKSRLTSESSKSSSRSTMIVITDQCRTRPEWPGAAAAVVPIAGAVAAHPFRDQSPCPLAYPRDHKRSAERPFHSGRMYDRGLDGWRMSGWTADRHSIPKTFAHGMDPDRPSATSPCRCHVPNWRPRRGTLASGPWTAVYGLLQACRSPSRTERQRRTSSRLRWGDSADR